VYQGFLKAVSKIAPLVDTPDHGKVAVSRRDARRLPSSLRGRIDLVVTSPPYLNAIDYMRGHRMSLVWLGYQLGQLKQLRSNSVGAERYPDKESASSGVRAPRHHGLSARQHGMLDRYANDVNGFMCQIAQVLSSRGEAVLVVGDSTLSGTYIRNSLIVRKAAERNGLVLIGEQTRALPTSSRYLPPPASTGGSLSKRMRHEVIMRFTRTSTTAGRA
jgi:hypothetical protein